MLPKRSPWMKDHQWKFTLETCIFFAKLELFAAFDPRRMTGRGFGVVDLSDPDVSAGYDLMVSRGELCSFVERISKC